MSDRSEKQNRLFRKILVALDSSHHSEAALEAAALIAKALKADMHGLFVQDERWMRVSRISSITEINELTGNIEPLAEKRIEEQIQLLEERIQQRFIQISRKYDIEHTWKSLKGNVDEILLKASRDTDLITIGTKGKSFTGSRKLGSTARFVIEKSTKPVLILQRGIKLGQSVIAVYDGSELSLSGVKFARLFAESHESKLIIIKMDSDDNSKQSTDKLGKALRDSSVKVDIHVLTDLSAANFLNLISRQYGGLLVIPKVNRFAKMVNIEKILYNLSNPILLLR